MMDEEPNFNFDLVKIKAAIESGLVSFPRGLTPEQRKEWIRKPNYLQQEVLDKAIEDGERRVMNRVYQDKYEKLLAKVKQNNQECNWECNARVKYCIDYLAVGRRCSDCPKQWKIDTEEKE